MPVGYGPRLCYYVGALGEGDAGDAVSHAASGGQPLAASLRLGASGPRQHEAALFPHPPLLLRRANGVRVCALMSLSVRTRVAFLVILLSSHSFIVATFICPFRI